MSVRPQGRVGSGSIISFIDCRVSCRRSRARSYLPLTGTMNDIPDTLGRSLVCGFFHCLLFNMLTMYFLAS